LLEQRKIHAMKVFGIAGYSGSGKTTLLEKLIPQLTARGLKVSVIKHAHHGFDIDRPGKDSYRHREAGGERSTAFL
jgi:molybdopterin-guanine dinucleotide biosynthesis protein B